MSTPPSQPWKYDHCLERIGLMRENPSDYQYIKSVCDFVSHSNLDVQLTATAALGEAQAELPLVTKTLTGLLYNHDSHDGYGSVSELASIALCKLGAAANLSRDAVIEYLWATATTEEPRPNRRGQPAPRFETLERCEAAFLSLIAMGEHEALASLLAKLMADSSEYARNQTEAAICWFAESAEDPFLGCSERSFGIHEELLTTIEPFATEEAREWIERSRNKFSENRQRLSGGEIKPDKI